MSLKPIFNQNGISLQRLMEQILLAYCLEQGIFESNPFN